MLIYHKSTPSYRKRDLAFLVHHEEETRDWESGEAEKLPSYRCLQQAKGLILEFLLTFPYHSTTSHELKEIENEDSGQKLRGEEPGGDTLLLHWDSNP